MAGGMIWDAFLFNDELDMLECRLVELDGVVDRFVIVEADVTFTNAPKPSHYLANRKRFARWRKRIVHVWATGLPTDSIAWGREYAQRERISEGLVNASADDLVLLSDVDEIPNPRILRDLRPAEPVALQQRYYAFAVDWLMPVSWHGTMALRLVDGVGWQALRDRRNEAPSVPDGGWHLSWLGGTDRNFAKLATSPHVNEIAETQAGLEDGNVYLRDGATLSVFGDARMIPVEVDATWPRWIAERRCPENWFRPRNGES